MLEVRNGFQLSIRDILRYIIHVKRQFKFFFEKNRFYKSKYTFTIKGQKVDYNQ